MAIRPAVLGWLGVAVLLAAGFWVVCWQQTADLALARVPLLDEAWYLRDGARVRSEGGLGQAPFVMSPGYTLLAAWTGARPPDDGGVIPSRPELLLALQALCWLGCGLAPAWALWRLGRRWGLAIWRVLSAAALAVLLVWLYAPLAIYASVPLLDLPLTFLISVLAAVVVAAPGSRRSWLLGALALGLAAALRAHVLVLLAILVPAVWRASGRGGRRLAWLAGVLVLALTPALLLSLHNSRLVGRPVGPSLNGGVNLYLGLQPGAGGLFTTLRGFQQGPDPLGESFLEERLQRPIDGPAAADEAWRAEAWRRFRERPAAALVGWLQKCWLHLQAWEIAQITPLNHWQQAVPAMRVLVVPWWLLVTLGLAAGGSLLIEKTSRPPWRQAAVPLLAILALLIATQSLFFVTSRYRLILGPLLAMLAGLGVLSPLGPGRRSWLILPLLALVFLLSRPWGLGETRDLWRGLEAENLATRLLVLADHEGSAELRSQAVSLLALACESSPRRVRPWADRARALARLNRRAEAVQVLSEAITLVDEPDSLAWLRIGLLREDGRFDEAEALMQAYLRDHPGHAGMLHDLAVLQGQRGRWSAVLATARRLQSTSPGDARGWLDEAVALTRLRRLDQAVIVLERGLQQVTDPAGQKLLRDNLDRIR